MKNIILICCCLSLSACSNKEIKADTPTNTTFLSLASLSDYENSSKYEQFKELFDESSKSLATKKLYLDLSKDLHTQSTTQYTTQIVKTDDGGVYVYLFHPDLVNKEFKLANIYKLEDFLETFELTSN